MDAATAAASQRLALSRERMRLALRGAPPTPGGGSGAPEGSGSSWLDRLKSLPGAGLLAYAVGRWWAQHPLRAAGQEVAASAKAALEPLAQRHPYALMLAALSLGGLLVWSRPWRWALTSSILAGLLPQCLSAMTKPPPTAAQPPATPWV